MKHQKRITSPEKNNNNIIENNIIDNYNNNFNINNNGIHGINSFNRIIFRRMDYIDRIGISKSHIGKDIIFLFNGGKMDPFSEDNLRNFPDLSTITVFDQNNVIGPSLLYVPLPTRPLIVGAKLRLNIQTTMIKK
jgi:hypothetical protein